MSDFREEIIQRLRDFVPRDFSDERFQASDVFFMEFENFKAPLIAHLANITEDALRNTPEGVSEEFASGHADGVINMLRCIAALNLIKNHPIGE